MYNIYKKINMKNISKNIHIIILIILIILTLIVLYTYFNKYYIKEYFIGNKSKSLTDLGDDIEIEKKDYTQFPPKSKYDLINNIFGNTNNSNNSNNSDNNNNKANNNEDNKANNNEDNKIKSIPISLPQIQSIGTPELEKSQLQKEFSKIDKDKPLLGSCDFYFNKCPNNKSSMATIKGNNLTCNKNGEETKKAEAIAQIKNGHISKITIINSGLGYNYQNPPKVNIKSNSGNGASAKAIVDKNGTISSIDIIDYGYGYVETPNIEIEPPQMDGVCHLCC